MHCGREWIVCCHTSSSLGEIRFLNICLCVGEHRHQESHMILTSLGVGKDRMLEKGELKLEWREE